MCNSNSFSGRTVGRRATQTWERFQRTPETHGVGPEGRESPGICPSASCCPSISHLAKAGPPKSVMSLSLNLRPRRSHTEGLNICPRGAGGKPQNASPQAHMQRHTAALRLGGRGQQQSTAEQGPGGGGGIHILGVMPTARSRTLHPALTRGESPLLQPQRPSSDPAAPCHGLGSSQLSASEATAGRHRDPIVPGSRELPQPPADAGMERAQHVCGAAGGDRRQRGNKSQGAKQKPRAEREQILAGKAGVDRDGRAELPPGCHWARVSLRACFHECDSSRPLPLPPTRPPEEGCTGSSQAGCTAFSLPSPGADS